MKNTKKLLLSITLGALIASLNSASATTINAPSALIGTDTLSGDYAYLWTVASGNLASSGQTVNSVTVTFNNITEIIAGNGNDITIDVGSFVNMAVDKSYVPTVGNYNVVSDGDAVGDAFQGNITAGDAVQLGMMSFSSLNVPQSLSVTLSASELSALQTYMNAGAWGLEFDPDCHFNVGSISLSYTTTGTNLGVPDSASTFGLLGFCFAGLFFFRRQLCAKQVVRF